MDQTTNSLMDNNYHGSSYQARFPKRTIIHSYARVKNVKVEQFITQEVGIDNGSTQA